MSDLEAQSIHEWLTDKHAGGKFCKCGDAACHSAVRCHKCGTEFIRLDSTTRENLIRLKADYRGRENAVRWFVALDYTFIKEHHKVNQCQEMICEEVKNQLWKNKAKQQEGVKRV